LQRGLCGRGTGLGAWIVAAALLAMNCVAYAGQASTPADGQAAAQTDSQKPMTKDQAKELFRSVDEILSFVSTDTKLPSESLSQNEV